VFLTRKLFLPCLMFVRKAGSHAPLYGHGLALNNIL
jgi:hypothetical protein